MPRSIVFAILAVLILGLALPTHPRHDSFRGIFPSIPKTYATTRNIALNGSAAIAGWNNTSPGPRITIAESDSVVMTLTSTDPTYHQFYIDLNGRFDPSSGCSSGVDKCSTNFGDSYPNPITTLPFQNFLAGTYTYYCSIHTYMTGSFVVKGFKISATPNPIVVVTGSSANSTIAIASVNGFSGTASLSATPSSSNLSASFNSTSVSLPSGGTSEASLAVNAASATAVGIYSILVSVTIGSITHTTSLSVVVRKPGFSLSPNPKRLIIQPGFSKSANVTLASLNTFNGTVGLSTNPLAGTTIAFSPPKVNLTKGQSATSTLNVTVSSSAVPASYNLTLTGTSGSDTNTTTVELVIGQDFNLTAHPPNIKVTQGSTANSTITLVSVNNFRGNITLSSPTLPPGLLISFNTTVVNLSANQTANVSVTISASQSAALKVNTVLVTGTNSSRVRSVNLSVTVSGFTIQPSLASFNLTQGASGTSAITLTSVNGFSGTMNLSVTGSSALTRSLTPSSGTLNANENLTVTLSFSAESGTVLTPAGFYVFNVTASLGQLSHSTTVSVTIATLPKNPTQTGSLLTVIVAGGALSLVALLSVILISKKRRSIKAESSSVAQPD